MLNKHSGSGYVLALIVCLFLNVKEVRAGDVVVSLETRSLYLSESIVWFADEEALISSKDLFNGPPNPYKIATFATIDCDFVEPSNDDVLEGTTPKFHCDYTMDGKIVRLKIKYDQGYNDVHTFDRHNEEVYANIVSERLLWSLGFASDQAVPVTVRCHNCPIEPWYNEYFYF